MNDDLVIKLDKKKLVEIISKDEFDLELSKNQPSMFMNQFYSLWDLAKSDIDRTLNADYSGVMKNVVDYFNTNFRNNLHYERDFNLAVRLRDFVNHERALYASMLEGDKVKGESILSKSFEGIENILNTSVTSLSREYKKANTSDFLKYLKELIPLIVDYLKAETSLSDASLVKPGFTFFIE